MENVREALLEFWPSLTFVASQSYGAQVGRDRANNGTGYGPVYHVSKYTMTKAFLATSHYKNQDSLAARMVQARYTGHFRFACKAFVDYMSDPTTAAAGNAGPEGTGPLAADYGSTYDRNALVIAAILYSESYLEETDEHWEPNIYEWWDMNCMEPNLERAALPRSTVTADEGVYQPKDAMGNMMPLIEFGPLRVFGSLRQIRDDMEYGTGFAEDFTEIEAVALGNAFGRDRAERAGRSLQALYRDRICDPGYKYTIEDAIGNPPYFDGEPIRDASSARRKRYDMEVRPEDLGESSIRSRPFKGCGLENDCNPHAAPNFLESSLYQFAYVTSSDDPEIQPGWHRLLHLKAFTGRPCALNAHQACRTYADPALENEANTAILEEQRAAGVEAGSALNRLGLNFQEQLNGDLSPDSASLDSTTYNRRMLTSSHQRRLFLLPIPLGPLLPWMLNAVIGKQISKGVGAVLHLAVQALEQEELAKNHRPLIVQVIVDERTQDNRTTEGFRTGREVLFATRCSDLLHASFPDIPACDSQDARDEAPYAAMGDACYRGPLELADAKTETPSEQFFGRLTAPSPPPMPPPDPKPPPPPSPPSPPPPPNPPKAIDASEAKELVFEAQRQFCDSVYLLSADARCRALALSLDRSYVLEGIGFTPPSLPPEADEPPPPPPPPSPPLPAIPRAESDHIRYATPSGYWLSTYFLAEPATSDATASTQTGNLIWMDNMANDTRDGIFMNIRDNAIPIQHWSACGGSGSLFPCRTGDKPERCVDGLRRCGTTEENMENPFLELDLRDLDLEGDDRPFYLFAIQITLPRDPELGSLLFHSALPNQGVGYEILLLDQFHNPLAVQCKPMSEQSVGAYVDGLVHLQHVCPEATASDSQLEVLRYVAYVQITLPGAYRMIWLERVDVMLRTLRDAPPSPPPLPHVPPLPPQPVAPPDPPPPPGTQTCTFYGGKMMRPSEMQYLELAFYEPCGKSVDECCTHAYEVNNTYSFQITDAGCCTFYTTNVSLAFVPQADMPVHVGVGTGVRDVW